jgi:hypothetical protein
MVADLTAPRLIWQARDMSKNSSEAQRTRGKALALRYKREAPSLSLTMATREILV